MTVNYKGKSWIYKRQRRGGKSAEHPGMVNLVSTFGGGQLISWQLAAGRAVSRGISVPEQTV